MEGIVHVAYKSNGAAEVAAAVAASVAIFAATYAVAVLIVAPLMYVIACISGAM